MKLLLLKVIIVINDSYIHNSDTIFTYFHALSCDYVYDNNNGRGLNNHRLRGRDKRSSSQVSALTIRRSCGGGSGL